MTWKITPTQPVPIDPYRSDVVLHITGEGANNSTIIVDSSPTPKAITRFGDTKITTAIADPFGRSAGVLLFDGTGDYLSVPSSQDFTYGANDFTIEGWLYSSVTGTDRVIWDQRTTPSDSGIVMFTDSSGKLNSYQGFSLRANSGSNVLNINQWVHFAHVRLNGTLQAYLRGNSGQSASLTETLTSAGPGRIGIRQDLQFAYTGMMAQFRITKGIARYTTGTGANAGKMVHIGTNILALPTAPFPVI